MNIYMTWTTFKVFVTEKALLRFVEQENFYTLQYKEFETSILKSDTTDCTDFETNYKSLANKPVTQAVQVEKQTPFGAKTMTIAGVEKKLYARNTGIRPVLAAGANQIDYTIPLPWCKILGIEVIGAEVLDYTDLKVLDAAVSPYMGVASAVLNQFAYGNNIAAGFYSRVAQFDADIYENMVIRLNYTSVSAKTIGINFILFEVKS